MTSVLSRSLALLKRLEQSYQGKDILLVGHGDVLQITLSYFQAIDPHEHRRISNMNNAQIRRLKVTQGLKMINKVAG